MLVNTKCRTGPSLMANRSIFAPILALFLSVLSGCAGDLPQSVKQSLSVIVPTKIDFAELEYYAKRSRSAYDPIADIRKAYPLVTRAVTVQPIDVLYFIETDLANRNQTLSIRGTAQKPNVWADIETALLPDSILGIPLHRGFKVDATAIYDDAAPYLRKDWPLRVTGHSLGGAVAVIAAAYLEREGYTVERVVTFGQPKITTEQPPVLQLISVLTRVINELDVVPMLPPYTFAKKYQHFSPEVILREGPDYTYLDEHDADRISVGVFWRNITDFSTKDHHMDGYLANIEGKVANGAKQVPYLFKKKPEIQTVAAAD
jgi:triacylglycerol lipase